MLRSLLSFLLVRFDFLSDGLLNRLLHKGVQFLGGLDGLGSLVVLALPSTLGIRLVAKGLSFGLVAVSLLETWFVLVAFDRGVVRPSMVLAPFLFLGVRRFGTLFVSSLGVVGFTSHNGLSALS